MVIKPLEEDSTPGTVKPFQVALVEPVAYQFQLRTGSGEQQHAIAFYQEAVDLAKAGELDRFVATASFGLARLYRTDW